MDLAAGLFGLFVLFLFTEPASLPSEEIRAIASVALVFDAFEGSDFSCSDGGRALLLARLEAGEDAYRREVFCQADQPGERDFATLVPRFGGSPEDCEIWLSPLSRVSGVEEEEVSAVATVLQAHLARVRDGVEITHHLGSEVDRSPSKESFPNYVLSDQRSFSRFAEKRRWVRRIDETPWLGNSEACLRFRRLGAQMFKVRDPANYSMTGQSKFRFLTFTWAIDYEPGGEISLQLPTPGDDGFTHVRSVLVNAREAPWKIAEEVHHGLVFDHFPGWADGVPCERTAYDAELDLTVRLKAC